MNLYTKGDKLPERSFLEFAWKNKKNRNYAVGALILGFIQFVVFKHYYPFASYVADSYGYIYAAQHHLAVYLWPIGYSWFLSIFHFFTHSETALVAFQYFFVELAALWFFGTIKYFFPLAEWGAFIYAFLFVNPLFLYLANCIGSDSLFIGVSLIWITEVIWMLHRPRNYQVVTQALLIFLAFSLRYNAIVYPLITLLAFACTGFRLRFKILGVLLPVFLIAAFMDRMTFYTGKATGAKQFSVFGGWQTANNALYMYPYINVDSTNLPGGRRAREVNRMTRSYFDTVSEANRDIDMDRGAYYMWNEQSPLKRFMRMHYPDSVEKDEFIKWARVGPMYSTYGSYLIKHHRGAFFRHYLLPNTREYFLPALEKLAVYNMRRNQVDSIGAVWFDYSDPEVTAVSFTLQGNVLGALPKFFLLVNVLFAGVLVWFVVVGGYNKVEPRFLLALGAAVVLLAANFVFSVYASPIVFRYQVFPMIVMSTFLVLVFDYLYKTIKK